MSIQQPVVPKDSAGYLWAYFTGEGIGGETISLALSSGNDALSWKVLNDGKPLITSKKGEMGLRDPFLIRSHDGSAFYLLTTDLKISGREGSFQGAQMNGSRYIEIFSSTDLIHWSIQEHTLVSPAIAGNSWAPKAVWSEENQCYIIFWASNLYDCPENERTEITYNRMMYATTKDFIHFSEPKVWVDVDGGKGKGTIDAVVCKENNIYYRFMKEESSMTIRLDRSSKILSTVAGREYASFNEPNDQWQSLQEKVGNGLQNGEGKVFTGGEGPAIFPATSRDVNGYRWFLFIDQPDYHGGPNHYIGFATHDLNSGKWESVSQKLREGLPMNEDGGKPRHGSIVSLTEKEYKKISEAFNIKPD